MRRIVPAVLALSMIFLGCRAKELAEKVSVAKDLKKRGTIDLMKEVSKDSYTPPKDGKLTDSQIQMYLKVREREKVIAQTAREQAEQHAKAADAAGNKSIAGFMEGIKTMSSAAEFATADIRAAKDLGYNTQEYLWVKAQILAVSTAAMAQDVSKVVSAQMDSAYQQAKKGYDEAKDEQTKQMYKQMLDSYDQTKKESAAAATQNEDPALAYNRQLLSKYENTLNALANEMVKYGAKEGDAQKAVKQWQTDTNKQ